MTNKQTKSVIRFLVPQAECIDYCSCKYHRELHALRSPHRNGTQSGTNDGMKLTGSQ